MAATCARSVVPPASTFAELFRRSRASSYDQAIAQTYSAPPASARRGNYGLKRPIPMPYKDSYISVPTFEHHAQFTDWNNAEKLVKFIRRMEEMDVLIEPLFKSSWDRSLGEAQHQWLIDSEFAPVDYPRRAASPTVSAPPTTTPSSGEKMDDLKSFGKQGPSQYGTRRPLPAFSSVQLNFESLSPKQFQHYLSQLRKLGPEFRTYLNEQYQSRHKAQRRAAAMDNDNGLPGPSHEEDLDYDSEEPEDFLPFIAAQNPVHKFHRQFLTKQFSKNYLENTSSSTTSSKIQAQPHRNGGLSYTHPSTLQSILTSSPLPGIVLQDVASTPSHFAKERSDYKNKREAADFLVLFGDFLAKLPNKQAKSSLPIYHPDTPAGVATADPLKSTTTHTNGSPTANNNNTSSPTPLNFSNAVQLFRITKCKFKQLPKVVSYKTHQQRPLELLSEFNIVAEVTIDNPWFRRNLDNPHNPGSPEYISHVSTNTAKHFPSSPGYSQSTMRGDKGLPYGSQFEARKVRQEHQNRQNMLRTIRETKKQETKKQIDNLSMGPGVANVEANKDTLSSLKGMINPRKDKRLGEEEEDDDEL